MRNVSPRAGARPASTRLCRGKGDMSKDNSKRLVKQSIYPHGGSRIWVEHSDGERELIADTYQDKAFAEAVKKLADEWYLPNAQHHDSSGAR